MGDTVSTKEILREEAIHLSYELLHKNDTESQLLLYTDGNSIKALDITDSENDDTVDYSLSKILKNKKFFLGQEVYVAHNHPSNDLKPSMGDFAASKEFASLLRLNGVTLTEEFIVTKEGVSSYTIPLDNNERFFIEYLEAEKTFQPSVETSYQKLSTPNTQRHTPKEVEKMIIDSLKRGQESAVTKRAIYVANHFTFENLLEITSEMNEIAIFGIPSYQRRKKWERIIDINNVFGSIETYSLNENKEVLALKKELLL